MELYIKNIELMFELNFPNRKPQRMRGYDYSTPGYYFVTICIDQFFEYFGEIKDGVLQLNNYGKIVKDTWNKIPAHFPDSKLIEFIVMPHHVHGILKIREIVGTGHALSANLSTIVGSFKSASSKQINNANRIKFKWQRSFYDHIIKDNLEVKIIRNYIQKNPENWLMDRQNINNLLI